MLKARRKFNRRERYSTIFGVGIAAVIAWWTYAPVAERLESELGRSSSNDTSEEKSEGPKLSSPGVVAAINAARPLVEICYLAEFRDSRHREQVVIVEFWAEIASGKGLLFEGKVPVVDSVSQQFDGCIQEKLFQVGFDTTLPPGRKRITFPFAFKVPNAGEKDPSKPDEPLP